MNNREYLANLNKTREKLNERLIELALEMAQHGKKFYDLKDELKIIEKKIEEV